MIGKAIAYQRIYIGTGSILFIGMVSLLKHPLGKRKILQLPFHACSVPVPLWQGGYNVFSDLPENRELSA